MAAEKNQCKLPGESRESESKQDPEEVRIFARWLRIMNEIGVPYVVGGAFAVHAYTGVWRSTKDLDVFLHPRDLKIALDALAAEGFETEITYGHWLAKVHQEPYLMDLIFGVWNGRLPVDEDWFKYALPGEVAGVPVQFIPVEELLTSKFYVAARDRFDGSDVVHLIRCAQGKIDWMRVLDRLGNNYQLLLWHLILFDFVYPGHSDYLPKDLMVQLFERMRQRWTIPQAPNIFCGTLLDQFSFVVDVKDWNYDNPCDLRPLVDSRGKLL